MATIEQQDIASFSHSKLIRLCIRYNDKVKELEEEVQRLKVCPVCDKLDPDGLEACSKCYCEQIRDGEISQLKAETERLGKKLKETEAEVISLLEEKHCWIKVKR